jgi:protein O-GlcNAcase/histone acetyltransferase
MPNTESIAFLAGVIEGFYGQLWNQRERFELFELMVSWGLNTYLYAPKDDLKHRAVWREAYSFEELAPLQDLIQRCKARGIHFIYALSPGLDIRYSDASEMESLQGRFKQVLASGCEHFALLFDDIPDRMLAADRDKFGAFALAQCHIANALFRWIRDRSPRARFLFCPTPYCGRMAGRKLGGENYLETIGRELLPEIDVFWTGPEIISREITVSHVQEVQRVLRRKPLIWDNLHANDYDGRRFYCGPYAGRPPELRDAVNGVLINPNCEFPLNFVPLRTFARFVQCEAAWDPRKEYLAAMEEWLAHFETIHRPMALADLVLLGDCYYLPFEEGAEAEAFFQRTCHLLAVDPKQRGEDATAFRQQSARLREFCARLTELKRRPLFHALSRRVWELREEIDLLERYVTAKGDGKLPDAPCRSDFHLPGTYRGGMVPRLQRLLVQHPDGTFAPARGTEPLSDSTS